MIEISCTEHASGQDCKNPKALPSEAGDYNLAIHIEQHDPNASEGGTIFYIYGQHFGSDDVPI